MAYQPTEPKRIQKIDYDGSGLIIYQGDANAGSATSASVWRIRKFLYDGSNNLTDVLFADGDTLFDNVWDNRTSLSYS